MKIKLTPRRDSCLNFFGLLIPLRWSLRSKNMDKIIFTIVLTKN
jgi:hypothetical protein